MKRRDFLTVLAAGMAAASPALAQDYVRSIVRQLRKQGFSAIVEERTLLGRVRIVAVSRDGQREIIVNPNNGEILRDLWSPSGNGVTEVTIIDDRKPGKGKDKDKGGSDDDGDDDDDDDDDDRDDGDDDKD